VRCSIDVRNKRRVLCVFPRYTPSFGTFNHAYRLMRGVRAFMPPQGLLLIAAYMPASWQVRFVDENIRPAKPAELAWADVVLISGMHIQAPQIRDIDRRAKAAGKVTVLGGPSASASPEMYPEIDYLHIGELGDATDALIARLDDSVAPPPQQLRLTTQERVALADFPIPAYDLIPLKKYLLCTLQFSSGCPYRCEFCDIPALYGRQPRLKTPQQIIAELNAMRSQSGHPNTVYFVDDNFIGNRKATREMLPHLLEEILGLMREAQFVGLFVGIETPEADALKAMRKEQNVASPMMESIRTLNDYGLEVTSGIILGLDTDSEDTESRLKEFIDLSKIPMLTINLLQALPKTPLWDRLARDKRLDHEPGRESNVCFLRPYDEVVATWRRSIAYANDPERLFERFRYQVENTYTNRKAVDAAGKLNWGNLSRAAVMVFRILVYLVVLSDYRRPYLRAAREAFKRGQFDAVIGMAFIGYHLIEFSREALRGEQNASFYSQARKDRAADRPQERVAIPKSA